MSKLLTKYVVLSGLLIMLGTTVVFGYIRINDKEQAAQTNNEQPEQIRSPRIDTAYYAATLPPGCTIQSQDEPATAEMLMEVYATCDGIAGPTIHITLHTISSQAYPEVPLYQQYSKNAAYERVAFGGTPIAVESFAGTQTGKYEIVGFWKQGGLYAVISVGSMSENNQTSNQYFAQIVGNWQWR